MTPLELINPFAAPVFFEETVSSTMNVSRELASQGFPHGTVIAADYQDEGRGRTSGRTWEMNKGESLAFTVLLRYAHIGQIPRAMTLRTGLAVSLAIGNFAPTLTGKIFIKWPNDIMLDTKKVCGILTEADGKAVHIGIGINVAQKEFPSHLSVKATSISLACGSSLEPQVRFVLLEKILASLYKEFQSGENSAANGSNAHNAAVLDSGSPAWRSRIEERLYKKGEQVTFAPGAAGSGSEITGILTGIGPDGELLILPAGAEQPQAFFSGELLLAGNN